MQKYTSQQLQDFARKLKAEQDKLEPHLTYDQMCRILGYKYDQSITRILDRLVQVGMAKAVSFGDGKRHYRIL